MAQEYSLERVLGSEERSCRDGRASMNALKGKGQAKPRPAQCVTARRPNRPNKLLKINRFSL